jgi:mannose-6-phosphate isomerase-like protein (cupin superfamily)
VRSYTSINLYKKLALFNDLWSPKIVAEMNDYQFKLVKFKGEFVWHDHKDTDEVFIVLAGEMEIEFRDGVARVQEGEMFVVPRATEHRTGAADLCQALVIEPRGVINTGNVGGELTASGNVWI